VHCENNSTVEKETLEYTQTKYKSVSLPVSLRFFFQMWLKLTIDLFFLSFAVVVVAAAVAVVLWPSFYSLLLLVTLWELWFLILMFVLFHNYYLLVLVVIAFVLVMALIGVPIIALDDTGDTTVAVTSVLSQL